MSSTCQAPRNWAIPLNNDLPLIIIGSGGHSRVLIDGLQMLGRTILFCTDVDSSRKGETLLGVPVKGDDQLIAEFAQSKVQLVNGIGSIGKPSLRKTIFENWTGNGYEFAGIVHPSAIVSPTAMIEQGAQIMAGAIIQSGAVIGRNSIVNTGASIDHDCHIGPHTHIAPRVTLSGSVRVGGCTHIGTSASVIQCISIGTRCIVGAGATVLNDLSDDTVAFGTPAKPRSPR